MDAAERLKRNARDYPHLCLGAIRETSEGRNAILCVADSIRARRMDPHVQKYPRVRIP